MGKPIWRGPFQSEYGFHSVLVTRRTESNLPEFDRLRQRVEQDLFQQRMKQELQNLERGVIKNYRIIIDDELTERLGTRPAIEP